MFGKPWGRGYHPIPSVSEPSGESPLQSAPKPLAYTPYQPANRRLGGEKHTFKLPDMPDLQPIKPHKGLISTLVGATMG
jgi:hypothetical protein